MRWIALAAWMMVACTKDTTDDTSDTEVVDEDGDGDGFTEEEGDCNDRDDLVYPGADDTPYDGIDSDCAEDSDYDADGDGFDSDEYGGTDCDDTDDEIYPGADDEPYDDVDADCAEDSDYDGDGDGQDSDDYGGTDCDDENDAIYDGADEVCNGEDDDCDTFTDEEDAIDPSSWYEDSDGDDYGNPDVSVVQCDAPADWVADNTDCDDDNPDAFPGATAIECDGVENDCDTTTREAQVVKLDGNVVADLPTAFDDAEDGSTIEVCEGHYTVLTGGVDDLIIRDSLTLTGIGAPEHTIIESVGGNARMIRVQDVEATISNLTLTGGEGWAYTPTGDAGGGVLIENGGDLTLIDVIVRDNVAQYGAGIYVGEGGSLDMLGVVVEGNHASGGVFSDGGGIHGADSSSIIGENTIIRLNSAASGGGVSLGDEAVLTGHGSTIVTGNTCTHEGAGMHTGPGAASVSGVTVAANVSDNAGGGVYASGPLVMNDSIVSFNVTGLNGGAFRATDDLSLEDVTIEGNEADANGGGIYATGGGAIDLTDCVVNGNAGSGTLSSWLAGGIFLWGGVVTSTNTDWGTSGTDNSPFDIQLDDAALTTNVDGVATFTCSDTVGSTCP